MGWLSSVCSFVSNTVSNIGSAVSGFCTNVLPRLGPMIEKGLATLGPLGQIAQCVLQAFNIFKPQDKIEDMGDRALQAADKDIRPEKFDRFDNYLEYIRNMELDPEKSQKNTPEQKIVAGLAIGAKGLEEKLNAPEGSMGNLWVLAAAVPAFFNETRLESILKSGTDITSVMRYFDGKLDLPEARSIEKTLVDVERKLAPEKSDDAIYNDLDKAGEAVRNTSA